MFHDMTISELCKTDDHICKDNIYNLYSEQNNISQFKYTLPCILLYVSLFRFVKDLKRLAIINVFSILLLGFMIYIHSEYSHTEICQFPRWCHEGINNTIIENSYFYRMNKCPKFGSWLVYYYEDIINYNLNQNHCKESLYGCCRVDNTACDTYFREGDSYSLYQRKIDSSKWLTSMEKIDESGSNCPTIEEIIYKVSSNVIKINLNYEIIMILLIIIFMDIYIPCKYNYLIFKGGDKIIISQSDIEDGDSDDVREGGSRLTQNDQNELKREQITIKASA
tara:strand:- start:519 stop:1358 length:840 start_codon:yes stop_codon:yes gene_type:complete